MVDMHCHILPGLDDGAATMDEAVAMAGIAAASGIAHIVATSHGNCPPYSYTLEEYREAFDALQEELIQREIPVKLHPGMEIFLDGDAVPLLREKRLLTLGGTETVLAEFPFEERPDVVCRRLDELKEAGYRIVLAHPERYIFLQRDPEFAGYLARSGCVMQINQGSLVGDFGESCRRLAMQMLQEGIVGVIATDAHDTEYRSHDLTRLMRFLEDGCSGRERHIWLSENPSRILKGMQPLSC
ncbi:MAG: hypothetical protein LUI14_00440 [Lachnospiraceae bacterium]|nr:hypothetical protein [Lachnospiraceae bacterium]